MRMHCYPGFSFRAPGFNSYVGRAEGRVQGLDYIYLGAFSMLSRMLMRQNVNNDVRKDRPVV